MPEHDIDLIHTQIDRCLEYDRFWRTEALKYERGDFTESGDPKRRDCFNIAKKFAELHAQILEYERSL